MEFRSRRLCAAVLSMPLWTVLADCPVVRAQEAGTVQAWNRYYQWANAKVEREVGDPGAFLIQDRLPPAKKGEVTKLLRGGMTYIDRVAGVVPAGQEFYVPDGEIHHWWGTVLVPRVKLPELMTFLQDYDHHGGRFADVVSSRLISREGQLFVFAFRLMRSKTFVTVYYNTLQEANYYPIDSGRAWSRSTATRIAELEDPNTPRERELPAGEDRGFLWRLVSWWRYRETAEGVIVEIESASLSRSIPAYIRWIPGISGYIRSTPRESLESVLFSIRNHFAASGQATAFSARRRSAPFRDSPGR
jgi:hypothetical protein